MSDLDALKKLLNIAYNAGFNKGNGMDSGCRPGDHGDFEEFWARLDGGDITTVLAAMLGATGPAMLPDCGPGVVIEFKQGDFVVTHIEREYDKTVVMLRDRDGYEKDAKVAHDLWGPPVSNPSSPAMQQTQRTTGPSAPPIPGIMDRSRRQESQRGSTCHCDGPPHGYSPGWCPAEGPVVDPLFRRP